MVLSMDSREPGGYAVNAQKLKKTGSSSAFMDKFYSNYGHKSIGDNGFTAIALDRVSMLAAISLVHHPLFNGQETSTRYVDVTKLDFTIPDMDDSERLSELLEECFSIYAECLKPLIEHLRSKHPYEEGWKPETYEATLEKKAFDILGSLLPAGARTNVAIVMNLRQFRDHLSTLRYHPLSEVREVTKGMLYLLRNQYPGAFARMEPDPEAKDYMEKKAREEYRKLCMSTVYYENVESTGRRPVISDRIFHSQWNQSPSMKKILEERPKGVELPSSLNKKLQFAGLYTIDFRSFRDLHRQRSMNQSMPLLTTELGFEEWYLEQMPPAMRDRVETWLQSYEKEINSLDHLSPEQKQYMVPMGYKVSVEFSVGLAHLVYVVELRTPQTVHPTVRRIAQFWAKDLMNMFPHMKLYANMDPDMFDIKRGSQTIIEKQ